MLLNNVIFPKPLDCTGVSMLGGWTCIASCSLSFWILDSKLLFYSKIHSLPIFSIIIFFFISLSNYYPYLSTLNHYKFKIQNPKTKVLDKKKYSTVLLTKKLKCEKDDSSSSSTLWFVFAKGTRTNNKTNTREQKILTSTEYFFPHTNVRHLLFSILIKAQRLLGFW